MNSKNLIVVLAKYLWGKEGAEINEYMREKKKRRTCGNTKLALQNLDIILMNRKSMKGFKQDIHII